MYLCSLARLVTVFRPLLVGKVISCFCRPFLYLFVRWQRQCLWLHVVDCENKSADGSYTCRPATLAPKKWTHRLALVPDIHSAIVNRTNWDKFKNIFIFQLLWLNSKMLSNEWWLTYVSSCCAVLGNTGIVSVGFQTKTLLIRARKRGNSDVVWSYSNIVYNRPYAYSLYWAGTSLQLRLMQKVFKYKWNQSLFNYIPPHEPPSQASSSLILRIQIWTENVDETVSTVSTRGGGLPYGMDKWAGMLVVSLRDVNFRFWSRLGCSGRNVIVFSCQGLVKGCTRRNNTTERILILYIYSIDINKFAIIKSHCTFYLSVL